MVGSSYAGIFLAGQLPTAGNTIAHNSISGAGVAIWDFGVSDTITDNTINDAQYYGIQGGNNVSGNTFFNVTTLTQ